MADPVPRLQASEFAVAAAIAVMPLGVYLATMYPGLNGVGDAAKFAFVGKVLGTPHAPGYPLYILLSHVFSYVPWGTLAYRMNALSALMGGVTVAIAYLLMRRLGVSRMSAIAAALALGFGDAFWSRSQYAKYYTLNAAMVAWGVYALVRWGRTRCQRDLYWSVAVFALASGNHLIIVALVPALVLFSLLVAPRAVLRPSALAIMAGIVLAGLAQYGLIWLLTVRGAPYLEARATNVTELWQVMTARRFAHEIGAFSLSDLWTTRIPTIAGLIYAEFGVLGLSLIAIGAVVLIVRKPREGLLLTIGAAGVAALTANMASEEDQGFMLPVFVLLWPLAGVSLDWLRVAVRGRAGELVRVLAMALTAVLPATLIAANYSSNNHRNDTAEADYLDALFQRLPDGAAVIDDEYRVNMMLNYKLYGEEVRARRGIDRIRGTLDAVRQAHESGRPVFALPAGYAQLYQHGARFDPVPLAVPRAASHLLSERPLYRLRAIPCTEIGNLGWRDVTNTLEPLGRLAVRIDNYGPFDSTLTLWVAADGDRRPAIVGVTGTGVPTVEQTSFRPAMTAEGRRIAELIARDGVMLSEDMRRAPWLMRLVVRVNDRGAQSLFSLDLGGPIDRAWAKALVDQDVPRRATICIHEFSDADAWPTPDASVTIGVGASTISFGDGWYPAERLPDGRDFKWTAARATLLLPIRRPRAARLTLSASVLDVPGRHGDRVSLRLNGTDMGSRDVIKDLAAYQWAVPVDRWRSGFNEVVLSVTGATSPQTAGLSADARVLGLQVFAITLDPGVTHRE